MMRFIALIIALSVPVTAAAQKGPRNDRKLRRALEAIVADSVLAHAQVGVSVIDPATGRILYEHNADKGMLPASNGKLFTTAVALDQLGPDWTFRTPLMASGTVSDGVLQGPLLVVGSGDPVIGGRFNEGDLTEVFRSWAGALKCSGIRTIAGDIIGDDNLFDDLQLGFGWSWDDEPLWYSAEIGALSFNDNVVDFTLEPTIPGGPARLSWLPHNTGYVRPINRSVTVASDEDGSGGYSRERDGNEMIISARIREGEERHQSVSIHNPTRYFVHVLREVLIQEGIAVLGEGVDIDDLSIVPNRDDFVTVAVHESPPMSRIVEAVNKPSHNLYAEQILKTLGATRPDTTSDAAAGSAAMGWVAGMRTLAAAMVDTSRFHMMDGSGLSRMDLVSPRMTTSLLQYMWTHENAKVKEAFVSSLPIGGVDGTLDSRMTEGLAHGNVRAKTGTLTGDSALSGYVRTVAGTELAFSIMMNNYTVPGDEARRVQDEIVETLASFRR
jgi:serine-type D-Ala-D-Ala carboxypeptidase/endopeptidase (penicillin-binding protein 4)